jgi:hypothetical protein
MKNYNNMGMQDFIKEQICLREQIKKSEKCPECGRLKNKHNTVRNTMSTLECYCGMKYYGE